MLPAGHAIEMPRPRPALSPAAVATNLCLWTAIGIAAWLLGLPTRVLGRTCSCFASFPM
jgi:hypothetical protein